MRVKRSDYEHTPITMNMTKRLASSPAMWAAILAVAFAVFQLFHARQLGASLLRADPDMIPGIGTLMHYALQGGRSSYRTHCAGCHGDGGLGDPALGVPALSDADWLYGTGSVSDIERIVAYGIRSDHSKTWNLALMPAFGRPHPNQANPAIPPLSPGQIRDVVEWLLQQQRKPADAASAARGAEVYQSVGACYDCHSPDAKGDSAIGAPNLIDAITVYGSGDRDALHESIANGRQGVCPAWIRVLSPLSIREVALYVYSLSHS